MIQVLEPTPVYFHNCRALGPKTRIPRALVADQSGTYVLCYYHKCPFCSATAGEMELAPGVIRNADGSWSVNTAIAEKMR
jgi:hypothetical protein